MKIHKDPTGRFTVSLARGDSIRESIESLCADLSIQGAAVQAIGAVEDVELGCYDLPTKTYDRRTFPGIWELLSLQGNITLKDGAPFLHAHVTISGHDYKVWGGHLFDAAVGVVVELFLDPLADPLPRFLCEDIGLPRWEPGGR